MSDLTVQRAAEVLMRHMDYDETPDSVEWLRHDADAVVEMFDGSTKSVLAALADSGWWGENDIGGGYWGWWLEAIAVANDLIRSNSPTGEGP